jgi:hypothetical protein
LTRAGLRVEQTLAEAGVITGRARAVALAALAAVPGVTAVEISRTVQLPPPGSPVQ